MSISRHLEILRSVAEHTEPINSSRIAAAVIYKNKIISIGFNSRKSSPFQARFSKHPAAIYLHAEIAAIYKARKILKEADLAKTTLIVVRRTKNKNQFTDANCHPCSGCWKAIKKYQIKKVIWTNADGIGLFKRQ